MCGHQTEMLTTTASNTSSLTDCVIPTNESGVTNISNANVAANTISTGTLLSSPEREFDENNCATNYIISNANKRNNAQHRYQLGNSDSTNNCDSLQERRIRQLRRQADWQWLHACIGKSMFVIAVFVTIIPVLVHRCGREQFWRRRSVYGVRR